MTRAAVILAAGAGARLGGVAKALLRAGQETYLARIVRIARAAGTSRCVVVVGPPHGAAVADAARALGLEVIENVAPERGMASSIALGFAALAAAPGKRPQAPRTWGAQHRGGGAEVNAAWLWPVDHPHVELRTLERLAAALGDHQVAVPRFEGRGGHPPLIARALWARLAECATLPEGARTVLSASTVIRVEVDDPAVIRDIDTPAELAAAEAR